jgi:ABC-type sugar transport system ATPase subunit
VEITPDSAPRLAVRGLTRRGFFHDVSLEVHPGEVLGLCGLSGAGRTELGRAVCGVDPVDAGEIAIDGRAVRPRSVRDAVELGLAYLPEDRKTQGLALRQPVGDNVAAAVLPRLSRGPFYAARAGLRLAADFARRLGIYPADPTVPVGNLSGGNQQKVLLAKWLATEPRVLVLDEPTRGVDVNAKATIHAAVRALAARGAGVVLISSDLPELLALSSRIAVIRRGRLIGVLPRAGADETTLVLAANGQLPAAVSGAAA